MYSKQRAKVIDVSWNVNNIGEKVFKLVLHKNKHINPWNKEDFH